MTLREKINYIWEYYKLHILSVLVSVLIIFAMLNTFLLNPEPKTYLGIAYNDYPVSSQSLIQLENELNKLFIKKDENLTFRIDNFYSGDDPSFSMAMEQRFFANLAVSEIDILISKAENEQLSEDLFLNLEEVFTKDELNKLDSDFLKNNDGDIIGIYTNNSKLINAYNLNYENQIISIYSGTKKIENAKEVLKYFILK